MKNGMIYTWGGNKYGQLGLGNKNNQLTAACIALPSNQTPMQLIADDSVYCLMKEGTVYAWGRNQHGQLGLGDRRDRVSPTQIIFPKDKKCCQIVRNLMGAIALMEDGSIYTWGLNGYGQPGLGGEVACRDMPQQVCLGNKKVIQIITCNGSVFTITQRGEICVWGKNDYGQLGLEDFNNVSLPQSLKIPNNDFPIKIITDKFGKNTYCLTENGILYTWGENSKNRIREIAQVSTEQNSISANLLNRKFP